jgi:hypothetical protein
MKFIGHVSRMRRRKRAYKILASLKGTKSLEDTGVNGRILLKPILQEEVWIQLAQNRDYWRALVIIIIMIIIGFNWNGFLPGGSCTVPQ